MNVNLWFARDNDNEIVSILDSNNDKEYYCPICTSKVIPKALESNKVTPHFAHVDVTKCNSESLLHWWFKHKFIENGDKFSIKTDKEFDFICKSFETEVTFQLESGTYRPDLVIQTECGQEIVFEMANTNKKKVQDYIDKWMELDKIVVEVDIKALQNGNEIKVFNALYYKGKCFNFNKRDGGYYNTIGKLKEQMKASGKYDIELVKNLDWFWLESLKLNNSTKITEELVYQIDELIHKYGYEFINILKNNKCSNIKNLYLSHKIEKFEILLYSSLTTEDINLLMDSKLKRSIRTVYCYNSIEIEVIIYDIENKRSECFRSVEKAKELLKRNIHLIRTNKLLSEYKNKCDDFIKEIENNKEIKECLNVLYIENEGVKLEISPKVLNKRTIHQQKSKDGITLNLKLNYENYTINKGKYTINDVLDSKDFYGFVENFIKNKDNSKILQIKNLKDKIRSIKDFILSKFSKYGVLVQYLCLKDFQNEIYVRYRYSSIKYQVSEDLCIDTIDKDITELLESSTIKTCKDCETEFSLNLGEIDFYNNKNYDLPKRCKSCRDKRKQNKLNNI